MSQLGTKQDSSKLQENLYVFLEQFFIVYITDYSNKLAMSEFRASNPISGKLVDSLIVFLKDI